MRHLGLVPYREGTGSGDFDDRIRTITEIIGNYVDLDRLLALAKEIPSSCKDMFSPAPEQDVRVGVAYDEAFNFYYADLFEVLPSLGASVVQFSPIHDRLPEADGYIIGGGYPELFVPELEANDRMREAVREVSRNGTPFYAECGGLMYLTDRMVLRKGWQGRETELSGAMCGVFKGETVMPARRVVSYVEGTSAKDCPMGASRFRGHEFHYSGVELDSVDHVCVPALAGVRDSGYA